MQNERRGERSSPDLRTPVEAWTIVGLLFAFMFIDFADRVVIGVAGLPIRQAFHLTPSQFGILGSSFFLLFSASTVLMGFLANRYRCYAILFGLALAWSVCQLLAVIAGSLALLVVSRVALGAAQGPAYPLALHAAYKWFPDERRALPTAIIAQGAAAGAALALPLLGWLIERTSWRASFAALATVGACWCMAWRWLAREGRLDVATTNDGSDRPRVPYTRLLMRPTLLACVAASFGAYLGQSLVVVWFTSYLIEVLGYEPRFAGVISALPWIAVSAAVLTGSWLSQHLLGQGVSSRTARGLFCGTCVTIGGLLLILMPILPGPGLRIAAFVAGVSLPATVNVLGPAIVSEFAPVSQRAAILCIITATVTTAGLLGPYAMGRIIEAAGGVSQGYGGGFQLAGTICAGGGVAAMLFLNPEREAGYLGLRRMR